MLYREHAQIYAMERSVEVSSFLETLIIDCCAPVLDGLKPGAMFSASYTKKAREDIQVAHPHVPLIDEFMEALAQATIDLAASGISLRVLAWRDYSALIYVYQRDLAQLALNEPLATENMRALGYPSTELDAALDELVLRIAAFDEAQKPSDFWDFPHEVGYFLGYPASDVQAYVRNRGRGASVMGEWFAYGCTKRAKFMARWFALLEACTSAYQSAYANGATLSELAAIGQLMRELP